MFGSKQGKEERLEQEVALLEQETLLPAQIAERLNVPRSTVTRDLPVLEDRGIFLQEAEDGKLSIFRRSYTADGDDLHGGKSEKGHVDRSASS
jgi:DNA-binding MarR family transcriptional regulator